MLSGGVKYCTKIQPIFQYNFAAIVLVASDEYAPFASVVVASIISNANTNHNYDIVVLTNDMLQRNRWRIEHQADGYNNISVRVLDISKIIENFSFYTWAHFTSNTYYRLLTPDVFALYEKVVYLDSDIVVNRDIYELFDLDLSNYYLAAAYDTHVVSYCTRTPPLEQRDYNIKNLEWKILHFIFRQVFLFLMLRPFEKILKKAILLNRVANINYGGLIKTCLICFSMERFFVCQINGM